MLCETGLVYLKTAVRYLYNNRNRQISADTSKDLDDYLKTACDYLQKAADLKVPRAALLLFEHRASLKKYMTEQEAKTLLEKAGDEHKLPHDLYGLGELYALKEGSNGLFKYDLNKALDYYFEAVGEASILGRALRLRNSEVLKKRCCRN